jgi:hypothetical protein
VLVGHVGFDHDVEEGLFLDELEFLDLLAPVAELVTLEVVKVVEHSASGRVLGCLETVLNSSVEVILGLVTQG